MTDQAMLKEMFGGELAQVDLKAIGKSRGFDAATLASPELMRHVFPSEQGVAAALALLTEPERLTLRLLASLGEEVDIEFFKRLYPEAVPKASFYGTYTERFKALFQQVKTQLIRRGLLLFGTLPEQEYSPAATLERRRFRFPLAAGQWRIALWRPALPGRPPARLAAGAVASRCRLHGQRPARRAAAGALVTLRRVPLAARRRAGPGRYPAALAGGLAGGQSARAVHRLRSGLSGRLPGSPKPAAPKSGCP